VVVFFVGGVTYEEAASVAQFNAQNPSVQVVLGSNTVHNSARCALATSSAALWLQ
jgi:hypothetical protein